MAMTRQKLEFAAWEPDAARLDGQAAHEAKNVLPAKRGYVPMPSWVRSPLPNVARRPRAAWTRRLENGTSLTVVATDNGIYSLENGAWVSKYTSAQVSDTERRVIVEYGPALYVLWGYARLLKADVTSSGVGTFSEVASAPHGTCMCVLQDFLAIGGLTDHHTGIRWSAIDDPTSWPTPGTTEAANKQSDIQIFPEGGSVQAIVGGLSAGKTGIIFLEHAIQAATYVGSPYIFQFSPIERARGLLAPKSAVVVGDMCVFLSDDGFRVTDGSSSKGIGAHRVDEWFFAWCDSSRLSEVTGVHDSERRLVWWFFPSLAAADKTFDRVIIYDYATDRWSWGECDVQLPFRDIGRAVTLEDLDTYVNDDGDADLDALGFSLDSAAFKGGRATLGGFRNNRLGDFNGPALEAVLTTQDSGGERFMLHGLRPLVDCGAAQARPYYRDRQMDPQRQGPLTKQQRDGVCYQHLSSVYATAEVVVPAGETWSHAVGVEFLAEKEGGI